MKPVSLIELFDVLQVVEHQIRRDNPGADSEEILTLARARVFGPRASTLEENKIKHDHTGQGSLF